MAERGPELPIQLLTPQPWHSDLRPLCRGARVAGPHLLRRHPVTTLKSAPPPTLHSPTSPSKHRLYLFRASFSKDVPKAPLGPEPPAAARARPSRAAGWPGSRGAAWGGGRAPAAARRPAGSSREPAGRAEPEPQPERGGGGRSQSGRRLCRRSRGAATLAPRPPRALTRTHTRALEAGGPGPTGPPWTPPARGAETPALLPSPVQRATPR